MTSSPRLLLCSASAASRPVEQQEVSEAALRSLFSMTWLDSVNREREQRGAPGLQRCLLLAHGDVFRLPWEDLVYPQLTSLKEEKESPRKEGDGLMNTSHDPGRDANSSRQEVKLLQSAASEYSKDSEDEYVELTELPRFSPQDGSLTQAIRASTHSAHTHSAAHTPLSAHTHFPGPCVEGSSHTTDCSRLTEENLIQDSCGPVLLGPVPPPLLCSTSGRGNLQLGVTGAERSYGVRH